MSIESELRELMERETAPLRARLEALERERSAPAGARSLLSLRGMVERHPAWSLDRLRRMVARRGLNGMLESGAVIEGLGRQLVVDEERFLEWARGGATATKSRPSVRRRRRGGSLSDERTGSSPGG